MVRFRTHFCDGETNERAGMARNPKRGYEVGERVAIWLSGIGLGYVVAQEALVPDNAESSIPLVGIVLAIALAGYFRQKREN